MSLQAAALPPAAAATTASAGADTSVEHDSDGTATALQPPARPARPPATAPRPTWATVADALGRAASSTSPSSSARVPRAPNVLPSVVLRC